MEEEGRIMIKKFKKWLFENFLPAYCKEKLIEENKKLNDEINELKVIIVEREAYIRGLESGIHSSKKILINNYNDKNGG